MKQGKGKQSFVKRTPWFLNKANTPFQQHKRRFYIWTSPDGQYWMIMFFATKDGALYSQQKQDWELTVVQIMSSLLQNSGLNWKK